MGPRFEGPFSKGKRKFWKNRLTSKSVTRFAADEIELVIMIICGQNPPFKSGKTALL